MGAARRDFHHFAPTPMEPPAAQVLAFALLRTARARRFAGTR
jgi:hypothetical protein